LVASKSSGQWSAFRPLGVFDGGTKEVEDGRVVAVTALCSRAFVAIAHATKSGGVSGASAPVPLRTRHFSFHAALGSEQVDSYSQTFSPKYFWSFGVYLLVAEQMHQLAVRTMYLFPP